MELVDGVDVGEEEVHQDFGHGVLFDHGAAEPLRAAEGDKRLLMHLKSLTKTGVGNMAACGDEVSN